VKKYDNPNLTIDEVMSTLPDYIIKDQFLNKLKERRSEKGKVGNLIFIESKYLFSYVLINFNVHCNCSSFHRLTNKIEQNKYLII